MDDGVDLIVDHRVAVQIRSTARRNGASWVVNVSAARSTGRGYKSIGPDVDVLAIYAPDAGEWWHVPRSVLSRSCTLRVGFDPRGFASEFRAAWGLYDELAARPT